MGAAAGGRGRIKEAGKDEVLFFFLFFGGRVGCSGYFVLEVRTSLE